MSLFLLVRLLPTERLLGILSTRVESLGAWGAAAFALAYVLAALLFVPGAALTLAAGAIFGLVRGTVVVSLASTTAAALAFLLGRHVARDAVVRLGGRSPRFAAIDRAIGQGGWRVVALLRLSPVVPFSLGNYLYGLTSVRFLPYLVTSWLAMLPGTFLYVYLGYAGREGLAAAGGSGGRTPAQWALLAVGLLATVVVTVYVTRLARRAMREGVSSETAVPGDAPGPRGRLATLVPLGLALVLVGAVVYLSSLGPRLAYLFGPPPATLREAYADADGTAQFDHAAFDGLLHRHVDAEGYVEYSGLATEQATLDRYIEAIGLVDLKDFSRDGRLALLLNAYNAFTLRLILDHRPIDSIRDIPAEKRWDDVRWTIAGTRYSLNQIEHELIRPNFREPRVHFALVCAAVGCPPLRSEAYAADRLEAQLEAQAVYVHTHPRWLRFAGDTDTVQLTQLYDWYAGDFEQVAGSVLAYVARHVPALAARLQAGRPPRVEYLDYDWTLNDKGNRR